MVFHGNIPKFGNQRYSCCLKIPTAPPILGPAVPHSIIYDFYAFYDSIYKTKAVASKDEPGYIIPGHEPSLVLTGI